MQYDFDKPIERRGTGALKYDALAERYGDAGTFTGLFNDKRIEQVEVVSLALYRQDGANAIDLIDFEYGPGNSWWHTEEDTCDKLSEASILKSGRLVCELLKILL